MTDSEDSKNSTLSHSAQVVQTNVHSGLVLIVAVLLGMSVSGMMFMFMALNNIQDNVDRELRIMTLKIDETNMILIREGKRRSGDAMKGPAGDN